MLGRQPILAKSIVDRRATNSHRRLLVSRKESNWRLVQASSSVDVYCVGNILGWLTNICERRVDGLVLASRCE